MPFPGSYAQEGFSLTGCDSLGGIEARVMPKKEFG